MIVVTLTRQELLRTPRGERACREGLSLFAEIAALGGDPDRITVEWTPLAQVWLSVAHPRFASWLRNQGLVPMVALSGANLAGANLIGAYRPRLEYGYSDLPDGWERDDSGYLRRA